MIKKLRDCTDAEFNRFCKRRNGFPCDGCKLRVKKPCLIRGGKVLMWEWDYICEDSVNSPRGYIEIDIPEEETNA